MRIANWTLNLMLLYGVLLVGANLDRKYHWLGKKTTSCEAKKGVTK